LVWARPVDALKGAWGPGLLDYRLVGLILFLSMVALYAIFA